MPIEIRPLHPLFVGEVSGVDTTRPLTGDDIAAIEAGMDRHAVLVFRDQQLTDEQQLAFSRNFGELEFTRGTGISKPGELRLDPAFADVSNLDKDNIPLARDNRRRLYSLGNRLWHSDSSFKAIPATYSLLSGRIVVDKGGETEFADMRAAYDALDAPPRLKSRTWSASIRCSTRASSSASTSHRRSARPCGQCASAWCAPIRSPDAKSLYLASHIGTIIGWPMPEARAFIRDLIEHATQPQFVYAHRWRQWDLVMWDNRQTMHRVRRYDENKKRDMRRTTVAGTAMTVAQAA